MVHRADAERYERMEYRRCGKSGIRLSRIALGLWHNFGGVDVYENAKAMLLLAFERGITHFDLANNYGPPPGSAEQTLGRVLREELGAYRDELFISTKAGYGMWEGPYGDGGSRKYLLSSLDQSLRRLGIDTVDVFYHHRPDPSTPLEESMGALEQAVRSGKALYAGISNYGAQGTREAARILRGLGVPCLVHQPSYSIFNRGIETDVLDAIQSEGMGCVVYSPLAQGLLSSRYLDGIPSDSRAARPEGFLRRSDINDQRCQQIQALAALARDRGQTLAQLALTWIFRRPEVTSAVIGASRPAQLEECVEAVRATALTQEELGHIDAIAPL